MTNLLLSFRPLAHMKPEIRDSQKHIDCDDCGRDGRVAAWIPLRLAWCPHCRSKKIRLFRTTPPAPAAGGADAPAPSGDDERMHCSLCGTPIYEDIISGKPDAPLIPLDENGECPECAAIPAPSGDERSE